MISWEAIGTIGGIVVIVGGGIFGIIFKLFRLESDSSKDLVEKISEVSSCVKSGQAETTQKIIAVHDKIDDFTDRHDRICPAQNGTIKGIHDTLTDIKVSIAKMEDK